MPCCVVTDVIRHVFKKIIRMNKQIFTLLLLIAFNSNLFTQAAYLEKGQSGSSIGARYSSNKDISGITVGGSYSAYGITEVGISAGRFYFEKKLAEHDLSVFLISPFIAIHAVKQDSVTPISVSLSSSFITHSYSSAALSKLKLSMSDIIFTFGGSIYRNTTLSPTTKLQPSIGVSYVTGNSELKDNYGNSVSIENDATIFNVGFSLLFQTGPTLIFRISPGLVFDKDNKTFAISAGIIYGISNLY